MNLNEIIASNLKRLRTERKLSLSNLAELSGVSKVMLGQIERGESNPTINTIWKIANGLKVPYTALIDEPTSNAILVKKEDTTKQSSEDGKYRISCSFTSNPKRNFELFTVEIDPHSVYNSNPHGEKIQEYILIFNGELTLKTEEQEYTLRSGDSIMFDAAKPHIYKNITNEIARMTIINYYPH